MGLGVEDALKLWAIVTVILVVDIGLLVLGIHLVQWLNLV